MLTERKRGNYGRKGGDSPIACKRALTFVAMAPNGARLTRRFFNDTVPDTLEVGVAALLPPVNGHPWSLWTVAADEQSMPDYVKNCVADVVFVECRRK